MRIFYVPLVLVLLEISVSAQDGNSKIMLEIIEFRTNIRKAVLAKDRVNLGRFFADGFTHTHASGMVDGKKERIDFFMKGEPTIEDVEPEEIKVNVFNKNLATAVGKTTLLFGSEKRTFQWTAVFYKVKGKWRVIVTHATSLRN
ncbi:MAG: nuclear transport factor 2 family protein [Blastocatellia bacterium]